MTLKKIRVALASGALNGLTRVAPGLAGAYAMDLFCTPRKKGVKPEETDFLASASQSFETCCGIRTAVYRWGHEGSLAVLAHGWESHAGRWRKVVPALTTAGYQVLALDAPAHGKSDGRYFTMIQYAEIIGDLIRKNGPTELLIGHSVGGAACLWCMGHLPEPLRPKKAVVMAAFSNLETVVQQAIQSFGLDTYATQVLRNGFTRRFGAPPSQFSLERMAEQLPGVKGLLLHDRMDNITPYFHAEALARSWQGATLISTEGYGHGLTAPAVTEFILQFARDTDSPAANWEFQHRLTV